MHLEVILLATGQWGGVFWFSISRRGGDRCRLPLACRGVFAVEGLPAECGWVVRVAWVEGSDFADWAVDAPFVAVHHFGVTVLVTL